MSQVKHNHTALTNSITFFCVLIAVTGCTGSAEIIEALSKDPATVCVTLDDLLSDVKIYRTNISAGSAECTDDGMKVNTGPPN